MRSLLAVSLVLSVIVFAQLANINHPAANQMSLLILFSVFCTLVGMILDIAKEKK